MMLDEDICESSDASNEILEEQVANDAAAQFGVTDSELNNYMARVNPYFFAREKVLGFARRLEVHPGIIVGRLQKRLEAKGQRDSYRYLREYLVKIRQLLAQSAPVDGWGNIFPIKY